MRLVRFASSVAVALVLCSVWADAGEQPSLVGRPAPEIQATDWIHGDGRTSLADFRGEVVLLEFWKTRCGASCGEIRHLARLAADLGRKGLAVVALTGDDDRRALTRFLAHVDPSPNYQIAIGGASGYAVTRVPCAVLIGVDGKVIADAASGRSIADRDVEAALKAVRPPTADEIESRAAKRLAFAERFASERIVARAEHEFRETARLWPSTAAGKKASERARAVAESDAAELEAQRDVAKLVGLNATLEHPLERIRASEAESLVKRLTKRADELRAKAPRAAKLAEEWASVLSEPWK
jgi:hypothetical protein